MRTQLRIGARLVTILTLPLLATCQPVDDAECQGNFGGAEAGLKVQALIETSRALVRAAGEINADVLKACRDMAGKLGIPEAELAPKTMGESPTEAACNRVSAEIKTVIETNLTANAKLTIVATPPACTIDAQFTRTCIETCEKKTITETEVRCKPGKLSGMCSATCMGSCRGSCGGSCKGSCTGMCTGMCSGTCNGKCSGTCSAMAMNAMGQAECAGTCSGMCEGSCSAMCTGSCSASCEGSCSASCMGTCRGSCDVMFVAPKCEEIEIMREVNECSRSCDTQARAKAECTAPALLVDFRANITVEQRAKLGKAVEALKVGFPQLLTAGHKAGVVIMASAEAYQQSLMGAGTALVAAGVKATTCAGQQAAAVVSALAQISVVVKVNVSVSASATASGRV